MDAWTQAFEDLHCRDVDNVDEDIEMEDEESKRDRERAEMTECPTQEFVTRPEEEKMNTTEMKNLTAH